MRAIAILGAILGLTSVIMGAASDHLFAGLLTAETARRLDTAMRYHQLYAIIIFALGMFAPASERFVRIAAQIFAAGTIIFCGGLYLSIVPGFDAVKYATPLGGMLLMAGWIVCIAGLARVRRV